MTDEDEKLERLAEVMVRDLARAKSLSTPQLVDEVLTSLFNGNCDPDLVIEACVRLDPGCLSRHPDLEEPNG